MLHEKRQSSFVADLIASTPPGQNPFTWGAELIGERALPRVPGYADDILIFFIAIEAFIILGSIFLVLFPLLHSPQMRKTHLWLWRKHYLGSGTTPSYVPNGGLTVAVCQFCTSALFFVSFTLHHFSFNSPEFERRAYTPIWLDMAILPAYIGYWIIGVNSLFTWLQSPHRNFNSASRWSRFLRYCLSPLPLNVFCLAIPILLVSKTVYWTIRQIIDITITNNIHRRVVALNAQAAAEWVPGTADLRSQTTRQLEEAVELHYSRAHRVAHNTRVSGIQANLANFVVLIFYLFTTIALVCLVRRSMRIALGKTSLCAWAEGKRKSKKSPSSSPDAVESNHLEITIPDRRSAAADHLQKGYLHITTQCIFFTICLLLDLTTGMFFATRTHLTLHRGHLRALSVWVPRLGSTFMAVAMLLQCWRIYHIPQINKPPDQIITKVESDQGQKKPAADSTLAIWVVQEDISRKYSV